MNIVATCEHVKWWIWRLHGWLVILLGIKYHMDLVHMEGYWVQLKHGWKTCWFYAFYQSHILVVGTRACFKDIVIRTSTRWWLFVDEVGDLGAERTPDFGAIQCQIVWCANSTTNTHDIVMPHCSWLICFPQQFTRPSVVNFQRLEILVYSYMTFLYDFVSLVRYDESFLEFKHA